MKTTSRKKSCHRARGPAAAITILSFILMIVLFHGFPSQATEDKPLEVKTSVSHSAVTAGSRFNVAVEFVIGEGYHIFGPKEMISIPTAVGMDSTADFWLLNVNFPSPHVVDVPELGGKTELYEGAAAIVADIAAGDGLSEGKYDLPIRITYQLCQDKNCMMPVFDEPLPVSVTVGPEMGKMQHPEVFGEASGAETEGGGESPPDNPFQKTLEKGLFWALVVSFIWGIGASLSPCVYPMIPITVTFFINQAKDRSRFMVFLLSLTYVFGITLTYSILGMLAALGGKDLGMFMVNPWVIGVIVFVFVLLSLSMFGLWEFRMPYFIQKRLPSGGKQGFGGAFMMGLLLAFVAAPCVGPFAGGILIYVASSQNIFTGFITLFTFGLGMGVLFIVLGVSSGAVASMPRSGMWLDAVKRFFGFVLLGVSIYFLNFIISGIIVKFLLGLLLVVWGTFIGAFHPVTEESKQGRLLGKAIGILLVTAGLLLFLFTTIEKFDLAGGLSGIAVSGRPTAGAETARPGVPWVHEYSKGLERAKAEGKPVFVDFYAAWCIPCKEMDKKIFHDPEVVRELSRFVAIKANCTNPSGEASRVKNSELKSPYMPYLVFFDSNGNYLKDLSIGGKVDRDKFLEQLIKVR